MSTKIYNAYRIKADSLDEVIKTFFKEKEKITQDLELSIVKDILIEAIINYDKFTLEGDGLPFKKSGSEKDKLDSSKTVQNILFDKMWNKKEDSFKDENPVIESQIILYPEPIDHFGDKCYLFQVFGEDQLTEIFDKKYFSKWHVEEYNYWDSTDQPDTITDYEWELRRKNWKNIDIPLLTGISITFVKSPKYEIYYMHNLKSKRDNVIHTLEQLQQTMTLEKRVDQYVQKIKEDVAYKHCYDIAIKENNLENASNDEIRDFIISRGMGIYFESRDRVRDDDFTHEEKLSFSDKQTQIRKLLKHTINFDDLSVKGEDILQQALLRQNKKIKP